ncbi:hypothetical protein PRCB_03130 [Pantoea rodasii]|uniref:Long-tail fiber proximal subunit trimerization domain-containing protein n=1 Tax=Pantoea rodasii TaxID=1076549 RepID=A0A2M9WHJ2_9GAMM|nr:hypothetical protein [Pantoea rodasii]ORM62215.1 hypothetical protein HA45_18045 [Pantoea rodasii]PJZ07021.1 hypothetical protein PRCB_03130 [Pantoea rodasii]
MKPLIDPINTTDGRFHSRDPQTGELATVVTPDYMNETQDATRSLQQEIIALLTAAGIKPADAKKDQLLSALEALFLASDDTRVSGALQKARNLGDLDSSDKARKNLGLGALALKDEISASDTGAVPLTGGEMSGELSTTSADSYRIIANKRAFFLRFDGNDFYILKTKAEDPDGAWDDSRPIRINAQTGELFVSSGMTVNSNVTLTWGGRGHHFQENGDIVEAAGDQSIFRGYWSATNLNGALRNITNHADDAWNKANDAQVNRVQSVRLGGAIWTGTIGNGQLDWGGSGQVLSGVHSTANYAINLQFCLRQIQILINGSWVAVGGI